MFPVRPDLQKGVSGGCSDSLFRCTKYTDTRVTDPGGDRPDPDLTLSKIRIWIEQPVPDPTEKPNPDPTKTGSCSDKTTRLRIRIPDNSMGRI